MKILNRALLITLLGILCIFPSRSWTCFDLDEGETATFTLSFDVALLGNVYITPFVSRPSGCYLSQSPVLVGPGTHTFPAIAFANPECGRYHIGALIKGKGLLASTVSFNTLATQMSNSFITIVLRGHPNIYTVTVNPGETVWLVASMLYDTMDGTPNHLPLPPP